jgi:hypothetical protein
LSQESLQLKLKKCWKQKSKLKRFNVKRLREPPNIQAFQIALENRYTALRNIEKESTTLGKKWKDQNKVWFDTCDQVMGIRTQQDKEWSHQAHLKRLKSV